MKLSKIFVIAAGLTIFQNVLADDLILCQNGKTDYGIHYSQTASEVDRFAVQELQKHLTAMSGVSFTASQGKPGQKTIFVGLSPEALRILGKECLIDHLRDQDAVIQTKNGNLFLYGKGRHGNLYAVYELLENQLGCRWLSAFGDGDYIPVKKNITIPEGVKKSRYAFPRRSLMNSFYRDRNAAKLFAYRNRQNLLLNIGTPHKGIVQDIDLRGPRYHVLSVIMPGFKGSGKNKSSSLFKVQDYYAIHPEWFSMDEHGKRVNTRQLCFSNKELRKELTKNMFIFFKDLEKRDKARYFHTIDLNDIAYNTCYCKECQALQKKYQSPGGSFFDFIFELCRQYPDVEFSTMGYQRTLTQIPPAGVQNPPKNLTVIFCPINGSFAGTLDKENLSDRKNLEDWVKVIPRIWVWYYPNTYNIQVNKLPIQPPVGIFERLASDIRAMARAKVEGTYFEHDTGGVVSGTNLSEMQTYVMYKLFQNPALDEKEVMKDFAVHYYGKAADLVLQFAFELEKCRKDFIARGGRWGFSTQDYDYLTEKNLLRWNKLLDEAARKIDPVHELRIRRVRMGLDCCIVNLLWNKPQHAALVKTCESRILQTAGDIDKRYKYRPSLARTVQDFIHRINNPIPLKPIPEELLAKYPAKDIKLLLPSRNVSKKYCANDPEANQKFARVEPWDGKKFKMGTYSPATKQYGPRRELDASDIVKGKYALYKLNGSTTLTSDMFWWGGQWILSLKMGDYFRHDDPESLNQQWEVYVSLKFTDDKVYVDRGFLVKKK